MEVGEGQGLLESCGAGEPPSPLFAVRRPKFLLGEKPKRTASAHTRTTHTRMPAIAGLFTELIETSWSLHGSVPRNDEVKHAIRVGEGCVTAQS